MLCYKFLLFWAPRSLSAEVVVYTINANKDSYIMLLFNAVNVISIVSNRVKTENELILVLRELAIVLVNLDSNKRRLLFSSYRYTFPNAQQQRPRQANYW